MNAPTLIAGAAVAAGTAAIVTAQEVAAITGAGRPTTEIIQIIGAIGVLVGIIGGVVVQIITARIKTAVTPVAAAVEEVKVKAGAIAASVDGTASRMEAALAASLRENERLRADKADQKEVAAVLAATTATAATPPQPESVFPKEPS